mgnify:CR=1 FL=1
MKNKRQEMILEIIDSMNVNCFFIASSKSHLSTRLANGLVKSMTCQNFSYNELKETKGVCD